MFFLLQVIQDSSGGELGWQQPTLGSNNESLCVGEFVPGRLLGNDLSRGRDVQRVGKHVGVAVLGAVCCVQLPEFIGHLAYMVEAFLKECVQCLAFI